MFVLVFVSPPHPPFMKIPRVASGSAKKSSHTEPWFKWAFLIFAPQNVQGLLALSQTSIEGPLSPTPTSYGVGKEFFSFFQARQSRPVAFPSSYRTKFLGKSLKSFPSWLGSNPYFSSFSASKVPSSKSFLILGATISWKRSRAVRGGSLPAGAR